MITIVFILVCGGLTSYGQTDIDGQIFFLKYKECIFSEGKITHKLSSDFYRASFRCKDDQVITVKQVLDCAAQLALDGDDEAEAFLLKYLKILYHKMRDKEIDNFAVSTMLRYPFENLCSQEAFQIGMLYFSNPMTLHEEYNLDQGDSGRHYGFVAYNELLYPMLTPEQQKIYGRRLSYKIFPEWNEKNEGKEDNLQEIHSIWYEIIKEDWESGKIKLKCDTP